MKKMILIILTIGLCTSSCSKDDDYITNDVNNMIETFENSQGNDFDNNSATDSDKIIGTWINYQDIELDDGTATNYDTNAIENQAIFLSGGTFKALFTSETDYISGTWQNMNDGTYKFVYLGFIEIITIDFIAEDEMVYRFTNEDHYWGKIK